MAAPDFPASPTVGQVYTAPSGNIYTWDGAVWNTTGSAPNAYWTDTGTALTPTTSTRQVVAVGSSANPATPSQAQMVLGTRTTKMRLQSLAGYNWDGVTSNGRYDGTNWYADDPNKSSWNVVLHADVAGSGDQLTIEHAAAGSNMAFSVPVQVASDGTTTLTVPSSESGVTITAVGPSILLNGTQRSGIWYGDTASGQNRWFVGMDGAATAGLRNSFRIYSSGGVGGNLLSVDAPSGRTTCTLADGIVSTSMLAPKASLRQVGYSAIPANWSWPTTPNTWLGVVNTPSIAIRNTAVLIIVSPGGYITVNQNGAIFYSGLGRNGGLVWQQRYDVKSPATGNVQVPLPAHIIVDQPGAGTYYYTYYIWQGSNCLALGAPDSPGTLMAFEFA